WRSGSFYSRGLARAAGAWSPAQALFACNGCDSPRADMNAGGVAAVAWTETDQATGYATVFVRRYAGGQWEATSKIFSPGAAYDINALAVSPPGTVHLLYDGSALVFASPTGAWPAPT